MGAAYVRNFKSLKLGRKGVNPQEEYLLSRVVQFNCQAHIPCKVVVLNTKIALVYFQIKFCAFEYSSQIMGVRTDVPHDCDASCVSVI